jgi:hypothetical protein
MRVWGRCPQWGFGGKAPDLPPQSNRPDFRSAQNPAIGRLRRRPRLRAIQPRQPCRDQRCPHHRRRPLAPQRLSRGRIAQRMGQPSLHPARVPPRRFSPRGRDQRRQSLRPTHQPTPGKPPQHIRRTKNPRRIARVDCWQPA